MNGGTIAGFRVLFVGGMLGLVGCGTEPAPEVTWYGDIQPLVARSCAACHDGQGVSGVDLMDPAHAQALAGRMAARVAAGEMPPPALDPACRTYAGAAWMYLGDDARALFGAWADAGAPLGEASNPALPEDVVHITSPDHVLTMPAPHAVAPDADGNEYHCVILDNPLTEPAWLTGLEAVPGDPEVVHHIALYRDLAGDAGAGYGAPPGATSFACRSPVVELDWVLLHSYAPGASATMLPEGAGIRLEPGEQLVMQMHYFTPKGPGAIDQSSYRIRTRSDAPAAEVRMDVFGPVPFTIPAGASAHTETSVVTNEGGPVEVHGLMPHMHRLGRSYRAWIEDDAGGDTCVARGNFDFEHQGLYMFDEPVQWKPGQRFVTECTWDNSASSPELPQVPPSDVPWGEGTNQEMCFMVAYLSGG